MKIARKSVYCLLIFSTILIIACGKKDEAGGNNDEKYLVCKLNGEEHKFNFSVNANDKPAEKEIHFVVISGWEQEDIGKSPGFGIDLVVPGEGAKEQTYAVAGTTSPELDGQYYIQNVKDGKPISTTVYDGGRSTGTNFTLNITSLTAWGVKGTFSGKLQLVPKGAFINVTDGKFSAPYN